MQIIIDGIDRCGKSTLINSILKHYGPHLVIHCSSPPKGLETPAEYQELFFKKCFRVLNGHFNDVIFDRCHLGEYIYGPLYRKTDPNFIFNIEKLHPKACEDTVLVLLYTDDFSIMKDDGLSFNFDAREKEQSLFLEAFQKSKIANKIKIRVDENGTYKKAENVFNELKIYLETIR